MAELKTLFEKAGMYTFVLAVIFSAGTGVLFHSWKAAAGIWIGAALAQTGLYAIMQYARNLTEITASRTKAFMNYTMRYAFYGIVMAVCAWLGVPVLSMLAGFLAGKLSLVLYAGIQRKEVENGNCQ